MSDISRNALCPCGSGERFKNCHGSIHPDTGSPSSNGLKDSGFYEKNLMSPELQHVCSDQPQGRVITAGNIPPGFLLIQQYLDTDICEQLINTINQQSSKKAEIQDINNANISVVSEHRNNEIASLGSQTNQIHSAFKSLFRNQVPQYYGKEISHFEVPQALKYTEGGFYQFHADSENWNNETKKWEKKINRDVSLLLYLNEDFEGGEIIFPNFNFKLKPKKGMLLCFPSDHRYIHKAEKTTSGKRYVIVSWAAFKDSKHLPENTISEIIKL